MANTVFNNKVLADKAKDLLNTAINTRSLMTVDDDLEANAGMTKTINTYTYSGEVEAVSERNGNTQTGSIAYVGKDYTVAVLQQKADYTDEDIMKDDKVLDYLMKGATQVMANKFNADFFKVLGNDENIISRTVASTNIGYADVVDAIADMNIEDESKLFLIISPAFKAAIRKDSDYKGAQMGEVIYNGMVGTIAGIPVIVSKYLSDENVAYLMTKEAATLFIKKEVEIEQDRNPNTRVNDVYLRTSYIMAVTDATKCVKIGKVNSQATSITTYTKNAKTVAGAAPTGAKVYIYINGVLDGSATAAANAYTYTAKNNLAADDVVKVVSVLEGYANGSDTKTVAA